MNTARPVCPRCGSPEASGALADGLCPACLITAALDSDDEPCPYRVLAPMSEDRAGVTYLAQALVGEHGYVALKVHDRANRDEVLSRYERWKPHLDAVRHPAIARFLDAGVTTEGLVYVATEFIAGWPLLSSVARAADRDTKLSFARQLSAGLEAAHAAGIGHMRLDPSRIRISMTNGPRATILGLGLALIVEGLEPDPARDTSALARIVATLKY